MTASDFIIIGGGASALACAIQLKRIKSDADVLVIEKLPVAAKKILATGNGRCNLSNTDISLDNYYGDKDIASLVISNFGTDECLDFFKSIGLITSSEEGRIYPLSRNASSVRELLISECENLGVKIITGSQVKSVYREESGTEKDDVKRFKGFKVLTDNETYTAHVCIMATGGKAAAMHGTDGDGYRMLKALGIRYEQIYPALVKIKTDKDNDITHLLHGVRVLGKVYADGLGCEVGEIQFTNGGVSGIAVMQFSGRIAKLTANGEQPLLHFDLCPDLSRDEICALLTSRSAENPSMSRDKLLMGIMNEKLAKAISKISSSDEDAAEKIKNFTLTATGTDGYKDAQVTHGGVVSASLIPGTLQAKNVPGLFICGELLNVDGMCGGYNLHFAWGSGILAAKEAAEFDSNK